ncbi:MAG: hypothetical protein ACJ72N_20035 [Labedaea sp.]
MRIAPAALTAATLIAISVAGAAPAAAQPSSNPPQSGSVTVTLSPEQVTFLCEKRLPKVESRTTKLIARINGGVDVKGSTAALRERAKKERDAGHEASAKALEERADRRAGKIDQLNKIKSWAADFRAKYCGGTK